MNVVAVFEVVNPGNHPGFHYKKKMTFRPNNSYSTCLAVLVISTFNVYVSYQLAKDVPVYLDIHLSRHRHRFKLTTCQYFLG